MPENYSFTIEQTYPLRYWGVPYFAGFAPDGTLYLDEVYGDEDWLARYALRPTRVFECIGDENDGTASRTSIPPLPASIHRPHPPRLPSGFEFGGSRIRGLRAEERIQDLVHPLTAAEKIALASRLRLNLPPPAILGLAERIVRGAAVLPTGGWIACVGMRIAYGLMSPRLGPNGDRIDYDSLWINILMGDTPTDEPDLVDVLSSPLAAATTNPVDCCLQGSQLYVVEGGINEQPGVLHIGTITSKSEPGK